jgi:hypothetical protein
MGARAIRASRAFDGRWVKTIVLRRPKRRASGTAARNESADSRFVPKNNTDRIVSENDQVFFLFGFVSCTTC